MNILEFYNLTEKINIEYILKMFFSQKNCSLYIVMQQQVLPSVTCLSYNPYEKYAEF